MRQDQTDRQLLAEAGFIGSARHFQDQLAEIQSLPNHKITPVEKDGAKFFCTPMPSATSSSWARPPIHRYKKLLTEKQSATEQANAAQQYEGRFSLSGDW